MTGLLTTGDHDRERSGRRYVYWVLSRRSRGVSVGVNLNPNNACNWRCIYCQVPGLVRGQAPWIELELLERELREELQLVASAAWLDAHVPEGLRRIHDIAISGNGEPTSSRQLPEVLECIARVLETWVPATESSPVRPGLVLITNGSLLHLEHVPRALRRLAQLGGEVWFKFDRASDQGLAAINDSRAGVARQRHNLEACAGLCPTWIQSCWMRLDGREPEAEEQALFLDLIESLVRQGTPLRGLQLYTLARASHQPEAARLAPLEPQWLENFARRIELCGLPVRVAP